MDKRLARRQGDTNLSGARNDGELIALWWARYADPEDPNKITQTQRGYRNDVNLFITACGEVTAPVALAWWPLPLG